MLTIREAHDVAVTNLPSHDLTLLLPALLYVVADLLEQITKEPALQFHLYRDALERAKKIIDR